MALDEALDLFRESEEAFPLLGVERDGHSLEPVHRDGALFALLEGQGAAVALRRGLELGKRLLLRKFAAGKLRKTCAFHSRSETIGDAVAIAMTKTPTVKV